uniref:ABC transporter ATP-binding protein n=1 Tax=Enterocloster clostridioformis TaxID=1531 RepID=UPI001C3D7D1E|nr:ABC transporter ATP-binding protein [Enterocloster clostridioformis]
MWHYVKRYLHYAVIAALFMVGEVLADLYQPEVMKRIVDDGVLGLNSGGVGNPRLILEAGLLMTVVVIAGGTCGSLNNVFTHMCCQNMGNDLRKDCFRKVMSFSFFQMDRFGTGSLITRVTNDVTQVSNLVGQFIRGVVRAGMLTFGSLICLYRLSTVFGNIVLCAVPFILACLTLCIRAANPLFSRLQEQLDTVNGILQEDISGIRVVKACVREVYEKLRFGKANDALIKTQLKFLVIFAFMNPAINALMYLAVTALLLAGSAQVETGTATPGIIMAAITYTTQLLDGILMLVMIFQTISRGYASWKRVREILRSEPELHDGEFDGNAAVHGALEFRDVSFCYPGAKEAALSHINLTVRPGETLAVIGPTGNGKSTLVNLLLRFYDVTDGALLVDGVDVRQYRQKALRDKMGTALQKSELFSMSLKENISWGLPEADDSAIAHAAHTAQAASFIETAPQGYDTPVAEGGGASLSGGQKQRISIARAVLKPAEFLIFDDSSSALDLKTEAALYDALDKVRPECTKILIAQRIATVRRADRIVVMDRGTVAGCGAHRELMESCAIYQDIYYSQLGKEETS